MAPQSYGACGGEGEGRGSRRSRGGVARAAALVGVGVAFGLVVGVELTGRTSTSGGSRPGAAGWLGAGFHRTWSRARQHDILRSIQSIQGREEGYSEPTVCTGWCGDQETEFGTHCQFTGMDRLRAAMQDENCDSARQGPRNAELVGDKISTLVNGSSFVFFRGVVAYFDYNMKCWDPELFQVSQDQYPYVTSNGDCHPDNYGIMHLANGKLMWGVNDFDQAFDTPFSWDVLRCTTGFIVACREKLWQPEDCHRIARSFIHGYKSGFESDGCAVTNNGRFVEGSKIMQDPSAAMIQQTFMHSRQMDTAPKTLKWLGKYVNVSEMRFLRTPQLTPQNRKTVKMFQDIVLAYLYNGVPALVQHPFSMGEKHGFWEVLDVAYKTGSGTGSIGLDRFYILLRGNSSDIGSGLRILEMKEETASALQKFFRRGFTTSMQGKRTADAARGAFAFANIFYGWVSLSDESFIIREKSKHKYSVKLADLNPQEMADYARFAGRAHAAFHLRQGCMTPACPLDEPAMQDQEICTAVSTWLKLNPQFELATLQFAHSEATRQIHAHQMLRKQVQSRFSENTLGFLNTPPGHGSLRPGFSCNEHYHPG